MSPSGIAGYIHLLFLLLLFMTAAGEVAASDKQVGTVALTAAEQQWLQEHPVITLAPDPDFKPIEYFDKNGVYQGAAADIIRILEKKLGITITIAHLKNWDEAMEKFKKHEVDLLGAMVRTPNREKFALFTDTLVAVPGGIFARSGSPTNLTLKNLKGKKVAVVSNYAAHDIIKNQYPDISLEVVPDVATGLTKASLGMVDVYVENMANATFYSQEAGITNLHLVGKTEFDYRWGIGIRKDWPELQGILNKGLAAISEEERAQSIQRWIYVEGQQRRPSKLFISGALAASLGIVLLLVVYWNYSLRKVVRNRTTALQDELRERQIAETALKNLTVQLEERVRERTDELQQEIRERKQAQEALEASERRFRELIRNSSDSITILDQDGTQIFVSDIVEKMLGYKKTELLNIPVIEEMIHPDDQSTVQAAFLKILQEGEGGAQYRHRHKDGYWVYLEAWGTNQLENPDIRGVVVNVRDITERKLAEEELRLSEQKFARIFNLLPDMAGITRMADGCFIEVNKGFERGTGWSREEALGSSSTGLGLWSMEDRTEAVAIMQKKGLLEEFEFTMRKKSGEQRAALMYLLPIVIQDLKCLFFLARDVTELKQATEDRISFEKQLLHAQKLESLGVLAGGIAHDFNNILTAIIGNAEMALMRLNPESPAIDNLQRIEKAAARAADLARQMLAYSGKGHFVIEAIDLNRLVEEMGHMLEVSISKKAVLRYNLTQDLPAINVDATQIRQIVMNLVINASEAIGDKSGVIAITTGCQECTENDLKNAWLADPVSEGLYVYLEVADTGCGMDSETLARIFDPFFTTKFTGRGLGMAAVLGIIKGHKGAIKVCSEPNRGNSFRVLLPAAEKPAELFDAGSSGDDWQGSGTVLLVDDEETVRDIGGEMLRELGLGVITATDGRDALAKYSSHKDISLVVMDLTMPHMDGEECFRELRQLNPDVKVIMSSGFSEHEVVQKFAGKGLAGFIQKPYKLSELRDALKNAGSGTQLAC
jgi:PAS domain S-box-containing protein